MEVRYPPPPLKRGISAILARYPLKTRGAILPFAILSRKGIARYGGAVSRTGPLSSHMSLMAGLVAAPRSPGVPVL